MLKDDKPFWKVYVPWSEQQDTYEAIFIKKYPLRNT